ncbi:riboflavin synthase domain-like protein [Dentipellis sp. KUC8613]|nr:riboflavin synthase domain-like protein [Dentipellis sp. KUC8613]
MAQATTPTVAAVVTDAHEARTLTILYATETGNAQEVADRIARHCRRIHFQCLVRAMDAYPVHDILDEHLVIFVVSTTGSGKEPRPMTPMWNMLLRGDLPHDLFDHLAYAVLGLGDSSYEKFCWPAKRLSRRLAGLGAVELCPRGEADDQHPLGLDGVVDPWIKKLLDELLHLYPLPLGSQIEPADTLPPPRVRLSPATPDQLLGRPEPLEQDPRFHSFEVIKNERITASDWQQDVRHFELRTEDDISYEPGDVAVIHPEALPEDVDAVLEALGWAGTEDADAPIRIEHALADQSLPDHLPTVSTLRALFTRHLDINAIPRRSFFAFLRHFTDDEREQEKLDEFVSHEGADDLYDYTHRVRRTIREVLAEFRHTKMPKEYVFDLFPPLRPREFSIASSVLRHPHEIELCIAIVQYRTKLKIPRRGVCTSYLSALKTGDTIRIGLQKGVLSLPPDIKVPVICVGPGTGIAPMRALLEARDFAGATDNTLYFGCRHAAKDQHYHQEWEALQKKGVLTYRAACSRDGPEGTARTYVQHLIEEDSARVWALVSAGAWVYISGSSNKMPTAVRVAIAGAARKEGGLSEEEAKAYVAKMEREGRLYEECWS